MNNNSEIKLTDRS